MIDADGDKKSNNEGIYAKIMRIQHWKNQKRITIDPGEYCVADSDVVITTLLGSCVSACLYDPNNRIVGMNHFLLSCRHYAQNMPICITDAGRYGIHSMELLLNAMWNRGAQRGNLKAKAFGGSSLLQKVEKPLSNYMAVGDVNVRFIQEFLQNEKIPLVASDLGGNVGRVIHFHSSDFSVYVRKIISRRDQVAKREEHYWKEAIRTQEKSKTEVELWGRDNMEGKN